MNHDERYLNIKKRLLLLTDEQLRKIIDADDLVYDEYNYDEVTGRCCPFAKAFDIPAKLVYNMDNRESDIKYLCKEILYSRFLDSMCPWTHHICERCNYWATHPINYCPECPGKIMCVKVTWLQHIKMAKQKHKYTDTCLNYSTLKVEYPSSEYNLLVEYLKERLK